MYVVVHIAKRFCLDRLSSEVSIVGTASDGPLQQQLLRSPVCSTSSTVVSNQQNENREESVRRNRIFSHRRPRPQLEVEFSGLFLLQSSMEAVTEVYHYAVVSSYSTLTILKLLSQHMRTERAS